MFLEKDLISYYLALRSSFHTNTRIWNNIIYGVTSDIRAAITNAGRVNETTYSDYNCLYHDTIGRELWITSYDTLTDWQNAFGFDNNARKREHPARKAVTFPDRSQK